MAEPVSVAGLIGIEVVGAVLTALIVALVLRWLGAARREDEGREARELGQLRLELAELRLAIDRLAEAQVQPAVGSADGGGEPGAERPPAVGVPPESSGGRNPRGPGGFTISI